MIFSTTACVPQTESCRIEAQMIRHRFHGKLMKAFLGPDVFEGTVQVAPAFAPADEQLRLSGS
jgi:hypothetical protein